MHRPKSLCLAALAAGLLLTGSPNDCPVIHYINVPSVEQTVTPKMYSLPTETTGSFKSFMDYRTITNKSSEQWRLQQDAVTDQQGLRMYRGRYLVAVGTHYSSYCGKELDVTLDTGKLIRVVVGDVKQDIHTDETHRYVPTNGNIIEFIVDTSKLDSLTRAMGDISYTGFAGSVISIVEPLGPTNILLK